MNWSKNKSITLSQVCIIVFAVILLAADVLLIPSLWVGAVFIDYDRVRAVIGTIAAYVMSGFAWALLYHLWKLLKNMKAEAVFITDNVKLLRKISWCCAAASIIGLAAGFAAPAFFVIAVPAAFMMLIVRIIKNVFEQAVDMKSELDLTI